MPQEPVQQESFVLRIWKERDRSGWRGWVQHTRSGESALVQSVEELLEFLECRTGRLNDSARKGLR